jgi:L-alanine-DL-glutamate epimerase-like enolase superfamily enzyme
VDEAITGLGTSIFTVPTPVGEADGTLTWAATTAVVVEIHAGDTTGLGWTYSSAATAQIINDHLRTLIIGAPAHAVREVHERMRRACRNLGTRGVVSHAISAVDIALWDLKARVLDVPLGQLFGAAPSACTPVYGSGGFTTLNDDQLQQQVTDWRDAGCRAMKIKVGESWGSNERRDLERTARLRELAGPDVQIMVDANGGYTVGQARRIGAAYDELGVAWFEEPVSSDDLTGLATLRAALRCDVAAGEYAYDYYDMRGLCDVVDCLQLDATRCGGYTGWQNGAALAAARNLQVSAHCAPALHAAIAPAMPNTRHIEWFVDHARLESQLFTGVPTVSGGMITANDTPGHGMALSADADRFRPSE